jgi:hypothetical protein
LTFLEATDKGAVLCVRLQPKAAKNELAGALEGRLKIKVNAPPVEGAANEACCAFLAKVFGIAKGRVQIVSGSRSRQKKILLTGVDRETAVSRLTELLQAHP